MPRYLYLLRHAESVEKQPGQVDKERELTPRGLREALLMGTYLFKQNAFIDSIQVSEATRAQTTGRFIADAMKLDLEKITVAEPLYEASARTFFQFITELNDQYQNVLCVAHNPVISYVAEYLTKSEIGDMVPAGLAIIKFNIQSWREASQETGELEQYIFPDMIQQD